MSGGLDSTQALIVAVRAFDLLGRPRDNIHGVFMPGFATGEQSRAYAFALMKALGVTAQEIDIRPAAMQMFADIGHPYALGEPVYDTVFENVQAGLRTDYLFRLAGQVGGMVVGTGDLSELALGWCTYGVGDHMSHYNVNASVPKTLIQHLIRWVASEGLMGPAAHQTLLDIVAAEITPELVPAGADGKVQSTEAVVGPYALQDFTLYYTIRYGLRPGKIAFLAHHAWSDLERGDWPAELSEQRAQGLRHGRDQALDEGVPVSLLHHQPVQALGRPQRARRFPPAARSRPAAIGARRRTERRRLGWRSWTRFRISPSPPRWGRGWEWGCRHKVVRCGAGGGSASCTAPGTDSATTPIPALPHRGGRTWTIVHPALPVFDQRTTMRS